VFHNPVDLISFDMRARLTASTIRPISYLNAARTATKVSTSVSIALLFVDWTIRAQHISLCSSDRQAGRMIVLDTFVRIRLSQYILYMLDQLLVLHVIVKEFRGDRGNLVVSGTGASISCHCR
jgi:hypothetical protein